jgi:putative ABC transport system permease protein
MLKIGKICGRRGGRGASALSQKLLARAQEEIARILFQSHRLPPGQANSFDVSSVQEMAPLATMFTSTMQVLVTVIACISLVVGGIGIMNTMLVSVTGRTHEIGIRLALGATPANVLVKVLLEAVALSLAGGLVGIVVGIGTSGSWAVNPVP